MYKKFPITEINTFFINEPCNTFRRKKMSFTINSVNYINHSEIFSNIGESINDLYLENFPEIESDGLIMMLIDEYILAAESTLDELELSDSEIEQTNEILDELKKLEDVYVSLND